VRNEQLIAARRVFNANPDYVADLSGNTITPVKEGVRGEAVDVTDGMNGENVDKALNAAIYRMENG
jgi:hypothetical protein